MSLNSTLAIAAGGLANINRQLAVVSHNVANANTAGYTRQLGQQTALSSNGINLGVRTGAAIRSVDALMQDALWQQNADVAALQVRSDTLAAIDTAHGTPALGDDLSSLTGALRDAFSSLSTDPSSTPAQGHVVSAARALANGINRVADAVTTQRQAAQDTLVQDVATLNQALGQIGTLSDRIMLGRLQGDSTADLEDQRDTAMQTVSDLTGAHFLRQPNGDVQPFTQSGIVLPTHPSGNPLHVDDVALAPTIAGPPVTLRGVDVTAQLIGGRIGAELSLRDNELPTMQAELDALAHHLGSRFEAVDLVLFTDGDQPLLATFAPGLANRIQVNTAVAAEPAKVRDGTVNPPSIQASNGALIAKVLNQTFGSPTVAGVSQPSLAALASTLVSAQTGASAESTTRLAQEQTTQTVLADKVAAVSGVSIDTEMSTMIGLQNAYAANARVISATHQMWQQLLGMVGG